MSEIKKAIEAVEKDFEKREKDRQIEEIKQVAGTILERISAKEKQKAELARQRHQARLERLEREKREREAKLRQKAPPRADAPAEKSSVETAVARAKAAAPAAAEAAETPAAND